ncbi:dihydrofolate reductase [Chelativorans alearense]|uniref:dihydrofolate reductase n=1 Tax=Chelativorans alearense TaxID=2681495 RepID=UPI0013D2267C|nr:dihydrofolate reductase [Chelativorans alearense]
MKLSLIVAIAKNGVIGRAGGLPWRLSTDLKRFKALTMGKPVVMGRKTWESIGRPLPGRLNIVISRDPAYSAEGAVTAGSLDKALEEARARAGDAEEICVIGGGEIYRQALARADILHVTHVEAEVEGDATFDEIEPDLWQVISSEAVPEGEKDIYPTRYVVYQRRQ